MRGQGRFYIFAGGGSGGHLFPGIAVAEAMGQIEAGAEVLFLCTQRQIDMDILDAGGRRYETQPIVPLPRLRPGEIWNFFRRWRASVRMCEDIMSVRKPAGVLGLGGYASAPAMKVANQMKIPAAMLNPDAIAGAANRYCRRYAEKIFVQWDESRDVFGKGKSKCVVTGCPIRKGFAARVAASKEGKSSKSELRRVLGLEPEKKVLVVMGGSQGGRNVNRAVVKCLADGEKECLPRDWQVAHLTGKAEREWVEERYREAGIEAMVWDFTSRMAELLLAAEMVVGRAGASSLAELTAVSLPCILLPYPYHKDQHQRRNAEVLERAGAAKVVTDYCDDGKTAEHLQNALRECVAKNGELERMARASGALGRGNAAKAVAEEILASDGGNPR